MLRADLQRRELGLDEILPSPTRRRVVDSNVIEEADRALSHLDRQRKVVLTVP